MIRIILKTQDGFRIAWVTEYQYRECRFGNSRVILQCFDGAVYAALDECNVPDETVVISFGYHFSEIHRYHNAPIFYNNCHIYRGHGTHGTHGHVQSHVHPNHSHPQVHHGVHGK